MSRFDRLPRSDRRSDTSHAPVARIAPRDDSAGIARVRGSQGAHRCCTSPGYGPNSERRNAGEEFGRAVRSVVAAWRPRTASSCFVASVRLSIKTFRAARDYLETNCMPRVLRGERRRWIASRSCCETRPLWRSTLLWLAPRTGGRCNSCAASRHARPRYRAGRLAWPAA